MADFSTIKAQIDSGVTTNGVGAITGAILNAILNGIVDAVDAAKQDTLVFDTTPTEDSTKPVTSGGVYDALAAAAQDVATVLADYYTKTEADTLLAAKADDSNVVHKTGNEIISGTKNIDGDIWLNNYRVKVATDEVQMLTGSKLKLYGDSYIDANGRVVTGLPTPTNDADAATKKYVDDADALKADDADVVHLTGDETIQGVKEFSGTLAVTGSAVFENGATVKTGLDILDSGIYMNGTKVEDLGTPTADSDAANKKYVDDGLATKQDTVSDLATIRSGAAAGATAVQPATMQTALDAKADKVAKATTMPAGGFAPNTLYVLGELAGDTTFVMAAATDSTICNVWHWTFETPATAPTITWPAAITGWLGGSAPTIAASKHYEVNVLEGIATYIEV